MEAGQRCPVVFMFYLIIIALIIVDQLIKILVRSTMTLGDGFNVFGDLFKITYIENKGMAFGMMAGNTIFLIVLPIIFLIVLLFVRKGFKDRYGGLLEVSIAMIVAGGFSNLLDRLILGSVTDYLNLKWFAIFNFADICATVGCILLCITICFFEKKE